MTGSTLDESITHNVLILGAPSSGKKSFISRILTGEMNDNLSFTSQDVHVRKVSDSKGNSVCSLSTDRGHLNMTFYIGDEAKNLSGLSYTTIVIMYDSSVRRSISDSYVREVSNVFRGSQIIVVANKGDVRCRTRYTSGDPEIPTYYISALTCIGLYSPFRSVVSFLTN